MFPDDTYAAMLRAMPEAADYRPMHGRAKGHDLEDGTHTRVKIDLFPEYIRHLSPEQRTVWDQVGRALCSEEVKQAFVRAARARLSKRRFGEGYAKVGMYPIPILTRDIPGYLITPHTERGGRASRCSFTCRATIESVNIGTIFHDRLPDGSLPKKHADEVLAEHRLRLRGRRQTPGIRLIRSARK